ncbi:MAG: 50S ribosomal protein L18 [Omnitrophica bacterium RIFCSPHIGHO2_02_FULL_63_14]|nr:MAG: 50S ribosomal protein L18 [Omnitrophica bacterium RIFCSPHIGHO2_02_FULL_63_14]
MRPKQRMLSNRLVRHFRIRKTVKGTLERPRLAIYPSLRHIEAQIVDDFDGKTLLGLTTKSKDFKKKAGLAEGANVAAAVSFGKYVAEKAKTQGIQKVVFDRAGFLYHGRVKAFADAARAGGLAF